jgi:hypothetical protein
VTDDESVSLVILLFQTFSEESVHETRRVAMCLFYIADKFGQSRYAVPTDDDHIIGAYFVGVGDKLAAIFFKRHHVLDELIVG